MRIVDIKIAILFLGLSCLDISAGQDGVAGQGERLVQQSIETPFGDIPISATVTAAFVTAILSLVGLLWKLYVDFHFQRRVLRMQERWRARADSSRRLFEENERKERQNFEENERKERHKFEKELADANAAKHLENQKDLHTYVESEKYRLRWLERNIANVELSSQQLSQTVSGLEAVIETGPYIKDLAMIKQTAKIMDVFGDFQNTIKPSLVPKAISESGEDVITKMTEVLISLSPAKHIRESNERMILLERLKKEMLEMSNEYQRLCTDFLRNPSSFRDSSY